MHAHLGISLLLSNLFYPCLCAAVDAYQGSFKITRGNFSNYTSELANETSYKYKELANKVITAVRNWLAQYFKNTI